MKLTCEVKQMLMPEKYIDKCDPCLWNTELTRLLAEVAADALKEIPEEYAQERYGMSRGDLDYTHFEEMCGVYGGKESEYYFPAYVILQTIEMHAVIEEVAFGEPCRKVGE